jgi:CheY-like chemotaxis protein
VIVDDNRVFLEAARGLLERGGLPVAAVAGTGAEALRQWRAHRPDVVLVDVMLGGESGFELARRLADEGDPPRPLVILISTLSRDDLVDLINDSPAAGFLPKSELSAQAVRCLVNLSRRAQRGTASDDGDQRDSK